MGAFMRNALPVLLTLLALPFAFYALSFALNGFGGAQTRFVSKMHPMAGPSLHAHALTGGAITALAMVQLMPAIRRRLLWLHKGLGLTIAGLSLLTAFSGLFYIAQRGTIGGPEMSAGFTLYGALMALCAIATLRTALGSNRTAHGIWARRLVILVLASWIYRLHYGIWFAWTDGLYSAPDFTGAFDRIQNWAFFLPYLLIYECLRKRA